VATAHLVPISVVERNEKNAKSEGSEMKIGNVVMGFAPIWPKTTIPVQEIAKLQDAVETEFVTPTRIVTPVQMIVEEKEPDIKAFVVIGILALTDVAAIKAFSVPVFMRVQLDRLKLTGRNLVTQ